VSRIVFPLRFFTRLPVIAQALQNTPRTSTIDASAPPNAYIIPICPVCNTGEGIMREEENDLHRYRCIVCGRTTPSEVSIEEAAEAWAGMESAEPTN
jgi:hypothetical protein